MCFTGLAGCACTVQARCCCSGTQGEHHWMSVFESVFASPDPRARRTLEIGGAAKGALERLDRATLRECIKIFRKRAKTERHLSRLFSFCKVTLQARYGRAPASDRGRRDRSSKRGRSPSPRLSLRVSDQAAQCAAQSAKKRRGSRDPAGGSAPHQCSAFAPLMCVALGRYECPSLAIWRSSPAKPKTDARVRFVTVTSANRFQQMRQLQGHASWPCSQSYLQQLRPGCSLCALLSLGTFMLGSMDTCARLRLRECACSVVVDCTSADHQIVLI